MQYHLMHTIFTKIKGAWRMEAKQILKTYHPPTYKITGFLARLHTRKSRDHKVLFRV
jgi:hypothetical protein